MKELQQQYKKTDVSFGAEPTGHYWLLLADFLVHEGIKVLVVRISKYQKKLSLGSFAIVKHWKQDVKRAVGIKRAQQLVQAACTSIGLSEGLAAAKIELSALLEQYALFASQLEYIMMQVKQLLEQVPGLEEMLTVPGVGLVTLAGFLAEVGDLQGYDHGKQYIRLAGFNLKENSSGKRKGKSSITKQGRSRLQALLFRAVMPMVAKNAEFKALRYHSTKRSNNPLQKKQSIVALCGKLFRVLHTLGTRCFVYNPIDVLGPVRQSLLQMAV